MRTALLPAAALAIGLAAAGSAEARQGCGLGFHRDIYGYCRPNLGPRPFVYPGIIYRPGFYAPHYRGWYGPGWHRWHRW